MRSKCAINAVIYRTRCAVSISDECKRARDSWPKDTHISWWCVCSARMLLGGLNRNSGVATCAGVAITRGLYLCSLLKHTQTHTHSFTNTCTQVGRVSLRHRDSFSTRASNTGMCWLILCCFYRLNLYADAFGDCCYSNCANSAAKPFIEVMVISWF